MFPKRTQFFKNWRTRSVHEPRRDRSAKLARRPARRTPPSSLTSTSGRCQVTDEASSCYAFQRRRRQIPAKVERRAFVVGDASSVIFVNASVTIFTLQRSLRVSNYGTSTSSTSAVSTFPSTKGVADKLVTSSLSLEFEYLYRRSSRTRKIRETR